MEILRHKNRNRRHPLLLRILTMQGVMFYLSKVLGPTSKVPSSKSNHRERPDFLGSVAILRLLRRFTPRNDKSGVSEPGTPRPRVSVSALRPIAHAPPLPIARPRPRVSASVSRRPCAHSPPRESLGLWIGDRQLGCRATGLSRHEEPR